MMSQVLALTHRVHCAGGQFSELKCTAGRLKSELELKSALKSELKLKSGLKSELKLESDLLLLLCPIRTYLHVSALRGGV